MKIAPKDVQNAGNKLAYEKMPGIMPVLHGSYVLFAVVWPRSGPGNVVTLDNEAVYQELYSKINAAGASFTVDLYSVHEASFVEPIPC